MTFLLDNFWKFLLLIIVSIGGYYGWEKYEEKQAWHRKTQSFAAVFEDTKRGSQEDDKQVQNAYWKLLVMLHDYQGEVINGTVTPLPPDNLDPSTQIPLAKSSMDWLMLEAMRGVGGGNQALKDAIKEALLENLSVADKLGIFESDANMDAMLKGNEPTIKKGIYAGQKLIIAQRLPISVARDIRNEVANFILLPETVAAVESQDMGMKEKDYASKFRTAGLIGPKTMETVVRLFEASKR